MKEPSYDKILKSKIDYYGTTMCAFEFAAEEYFAEKLKYLKLFGTSGDLLQRYIEHVVDREGVDFISDIGRGLVHFTPDEIEILENLAP